MTDYGTHLLVDFFGVDSVILSDEKLIEKIMVEAANLAGAKLLNSYTHKFSGEGGITSILALSESHLSIHTWPETSVATVDVYMCGAGRPEIAIDYIIQQLTPMDTKLTSVIRGLV